MPPSSEEKGGVGAGRYRVWTPRIRQDTVEGRLAGREQGVARDAGWVRAIWILAPGCCWYGAGSGVTQAGRGATFLCGREVGKGPREVSRDPQEGRGREVGDGRRAEASALAGRERENFFRRAGVRRTALAGRCVGSGVFRGARDLCAGGDAPVFRAAREWRRRRGRWGGGGGPVGRARVPVPRTGDAVGSEGCPSVCRRSGWRLLERWRRRGEDSRQGAAGPGAHRGARRSGGEVRQIKVFKKVQKKVV